MNHAILTLLLLAGPVRASVATPAEKAKMGELRAAVREDKRRLKQAALDQHKDLVLARQREKSDVGYVKSSALRPETMHESLLEVHEKSRRDRLAIRNARRSERERLRRAIRERRAEIAALRKKK